MHDVTKCIKDPFKVQDRPKDFNVTEYEKFTDTWFQILYCNKPLRNYPLSSSDVVSKTLHN